MIATHVVTYWHAYLDRRIDLCAQHPTDHPTVDRIFGTVGPVEYGSHRGYCDACLAEAQTQQTRAQQTGGVA
jgi:hypothetical protein